MGRGSEKSLQNKWRRAAELEEKGPALVQEYLAVTDGWFASLRDRSRGAVGREFNRRFASSFCRDGDFEAGQDESSGMAGFKLFSPFIDRDSGTFFANRICYRADSLTGPEQFFLSRGHERIHACQAATAPILHADIGNKATNIVLCPRDMIMLVERMEQDAYAKNSWLAWLASRDHPGIRKESAKNIESVAVFESFLRKTHSLQQALGLMAKYAMKSKIDNPCVKGMTAGEHYRDHALDIYAFMLQNRQYVGGPLIPVRLTPDDIWAIGNSFGPNTFGKDSVHSDFLKPLRLTERQERMIAALNEQLGIKDEKELPALRQALRMQGLTPAAFMAQSRGRQEKTPARTPAPEY
jgi:hypothetical protein